MLFDFSKEDHAQQYRLALDRIGVIYGRRKKVDITEKRKKRTLSQNNYFYLILSYYGMHTGYTLEEVKFTLKTEICFDIFGYEKNNANFLRSSADLNTKEMTLVIDRFKEYSLKYANLRLPDANEHQFLSWIEEEIKRYENRYVHYK